MKICTRDFGSIDVEKSDIIYFSDGIPGFSNIKRFVVLGESDENMPLQWLQSVDKEELAFLIINPFLIKKDYEIDINENDTEMLRLNDMNDVAVYVIVVVPNDIKNMTANLKAPIIINVKDKIGKQIILQNSNYDIKYRIYKDTKRERGGLENACID